MVVDLSVERVVQGGDGLAQLDGLKVFVPFAAPQERVRARIAVRKKDYAVAQIVEVIEPSPLRVDPPCPYYMKCGGCHLQHIDYPSQLVVKKMLVNETLQRVGRVFVPVSNITGAADPWHYRNKTQYPARAGDSKGGRSLRLGFFRRNTHDLLDIERCLLHPPEFDRVRQGVIEAADKTGECGFDEDGHAGNIRHVILRSSGTGGVVVTVVTRTSTLGREFGFAVASIPGVTGVIHNVNPHRTNRILGDASRVLAGSGDACQTVLGRKMRFSPASFFQVNAAQAEELCRKVLKYAEPVGSDRVLDLYSGAGMLSFVLAGFVRHVTGIEVDSGAVEDARANARDLGIGNVEFRCGDVEQALVEPGPVDIVVLDPPRRGCPAELLRQVAALAPRRIIYVSCNPATLARDLHVLEESGYQVPAVEPVDMFPQTAHVEVVAQVVRPGC